MDSTDLKLIALLREDSRTPVSRLAALLGVSRGTVQNRIDRLIEDRTILGFTVRTTPAVEPHPVRAVTMISVEGEKSAAILKTLYGYPEIADLHTTNGRWDIVAEIGTDSLEAFDEVLRRIRMIKGVSNSETSLLLAAYKAH